MKTRSMQTHFWMACVWSGHAAWSALPATLACSRRLALDYTITATGLFQTSLTREQQLRELRSRNIFVRKVRIEVIE